MISVAELVITGIAILLAYLWGHRDGARCQLDIMERHYRLGETFKRALDYEHDVRGGNLPNGR